MTLLCFLEETFLIPCSILRKLFFFILAQLRVTDIIKTLECLRIVEAQGINFTFFSIPVVILLF